MLKSKLLMKRFLLLLPLLALYGLDANDPNTSGYISTDKKEMEAIERELKAANIEYAKKPDGELRFKGDDQMKVFEIITDIEKGEIQK